jgi:hypothetical protein
VNDIALNLNLNLKLLRGEYVGSGGCCMDMDVRACGRAGVRACGRAGVRAFLRRWTLVKEA